MSLGAVAMLALMANSAGIQIRAADDPRSDVELPMEQPMVRMSPYYEPSPPVRQNFERRQRQQIGAIGRKAAKAFRRAGRFKT